MTPSTEQAVRPAAGASGRAGDAPSDAATGPITRSQFLTVFTAVMFPMFLASVDQTLLATATPAIARDFGGLADTSWIALGFLMSALVMIPLYGRLGDRFGHGRLLVSALAVFVIGSTLGGFAPSMGWLVAARVLQGLGGGGLMVLSQSLIGTLLPPRERPRFQGYFAAVFTLSSIAGPVIGGLVVHWVGWRWLFWGLLPLGLLAMWRVMRLPQPARPASSEALLTDPLGLALFTLASVLSLVWVSFAGQRFAWDSLQSLALVLAGALLWTALVRHERRHPAPFLPVDVLRLPGIRPMASTIVLFAGALFALVFFLPIYVQLGQGGSASHAGLQLLPVTLGMATGSMLSGRLIARSGVVGGLPRYGLLLSAASLGVLALAPSHPALLAVLMVVCGLGFGSVMSSAQIVMQTRAGRARLGAASALVSLSRSAGSNLGTALFGATLFGQLRQAAQGGAGLDAMVTQGSQAAAPVVAAFHWAFGGLALLLLLGAWIAAHIPVIEIDPAAAHPSGGPQGESA